MKATLIAFTVLAISSQAFAVRPVVSNVEVVQRETAGVLTKSVDITYDVENPDGGAVFIRLQMSRDRGATFSVPVTTVFGDIGSDVTPGTGKMIVWDAGTDLPDAFGQEFVAKVLASNRVFQNGALIGYWSDPYGI